VNLWKAACPSRRPLEGRPENSGRGSRPRRSTAAVRPAADRQLARDVYPRRSILGRGDEVVEDILFASSIPAGANPRRTPSAAQHRLCVHAPISSHASTPIENGRQVTLNPRRRTDTSDSIVCFKPFCTQKHRGARASLLDRRPECLEADGSKAISGLKSSMSR